QRVQAAVRPDQKRRQSDDPPPAPARRLGPGLQRPDALPPRLYEPVAAEDRARRLAPQVPADRAGGGVSVVVERLKQLVVARVFNPCSASKMSRVENPCNKKQLSSGALPPPRRPRTRRRVRRGRRMRTRFRQAFLQLRHQVPRAPAAFLLACRDG